ncbi:MAG: hypothetical protein M3211_00155 [Actinomycetota bacterium]|nr:hypothetical protein [Actinomycetota bacterium]
MPERAALEEELKRVQSDLDKASHALEVSVEAFGEVLGSRDVSQVNAAKEAMHMASERLRLLAEEERSLRARLDQQASTELSREAARAARSASRAAWATFWAAVFTIIAATTVTVMALLVSNAR